MSADAPNSDAATRRYAPADNEKWRHGHVKCGIKLLVSLPSGETVWMFLATEAGQPKEWPTKAERDEALLNANHGGAGEAS